MPVQRAVGAKPCSRAWQSFSWSSVQRRLATSYSEGSLELDPSTAPARRAAQAITVLPSPEAAEQEEDHGGAPAPTF